MSASQRKRAIARVLWIELGANVAVATAKAFYGSAIGSLAILTDAAHSMLDAVSSILGLVVIRWSSAPPDSGHPYGHAKHEIVAAVALGLAIAGGAVVMAIRALSGITTEAPLPAAGVGGFIVLGGTLLVNMSVARYQVRRSRELKSAYLAADAADTVSDIVVTLGVLVSFAATLAGVTWADSAAALFVAAFIGKMAWGILRTNVPVLLDRAAVDPELVRECVIGHPQVADCHDVRSRGPTNACYVDFHAVIRGQDVSLARATEIVEELKVRVESSVPGVVDVVVHAEPEIPVSPPETQSAPET